MRVSVYLLIIMTTFPLAACRLEPSIDLSKAATASPEAIHITDLVGKPMPSATLSENDNAYPESTAVLWADGFLWTANESGLLTRWDVHTQSYTQVRLPDDAVIRALASDGKTLYAGTDGGDIWQLVGDGPPTQIKDGASGVSTTRKGVWETHHLMDDALSGGALSLAIADDNTVWVAGESYIAHKTPDKKWRVYHVIDNPLLTDRVRFVVLDDEDHPWFIGRRGKIHFDGDTWIAYDADVRRFAAFTPMRPPEKIAPPLDFPSPAQDYDDWL